MFLGLRIPTYMLSSRKSRRLQAESCQRRPGKTRFSVKALRIGKRAVAGYDYVVVAVHEGKLIFWPNGTSYDKNAPGVT